MDARKHRRSVSTVQQRKRASSCSTNSHHRIHPSHGPMGEVEGGSPITFGNRLAIVARETPARSACNETAPRRWLDVD